MDADIARLTRELKRSGRDVLVIDVTDDERSIFRIRSMLHHIEHHGGYHAYVKCLFCLEISEGTWNSNGPYWEASPPLIHKDRCLGVKLLTAWDGSNRPEGSPEGGRRIPSPDGPARRE